MKTKKQTKKINKEGAKTKRSQSEKPNEKAKGKETPAGKKQKRIDPETLYNSLDYLHPKNQLTKKVCETVCEMQAKLDDLAPSRYSVSFSVSFSVLAIFIEDDFLDPVSVWDSETDTDEVLLPDLLIDRYQTSLEAAYRPLCKNAVELVHEICDAVEELPDGDVPADGSTGNYFIGRYVSSDQVERLSHYGDLKTMNRMGPPAELPHIPNGYFIFEEFKDNSCLPCYRWTKKLRWRKAREDKPATLIES